MYFVVPDVGSTIACGIATVAASVGYVCARRLSAENLSNVQASRLLDTTISVPVMSERSNQDKDRSLSPVVVEKRSLSQDTEKEPAPDQSSSKQRRPSLKRKRTQEDHSDTDADYPYNLALLYPPKKRSRTPTSESESKEVQNVDPKPSESPAIPDGSQGTSGQIPATPIPISKAILKEPKTPSPPSFATSTTPKSTAQPRAFKPKAFAAFAGASSPFSGTKHSSPSMKDEKPIWSIPTPTSSPNSFPNAIYATDNAEDENNKPENALKEAIPVSTTKPKYEPQPTGEEDEKVELELKGVKLFVKRGAKPFTDATVGHIKLLSNKKTLDERLLFRREPLWQVGMNVRVHPSMRCFLDKEEKVLRVISQEAVAIERTETSPAVDERSCEIVIYAMKPGRSCPKQDFLKFADSLVQSPAFKTMSDE